MEITIEEESDIQVFYIQGEIDFYNSRKVGEAIRRSVSRKKNKIVLDLREVPYVDSSALIVLMKGVNELRRIDGSLKLVNVRESLRRVLDLTGLIAYIDIYYSVDHALASFA